MLLQSKSDPFARGNKNLTVFEMVCHCTCNINFTCTRYVVRSRSNNDIVTVNTLFLNNIRFSSLFNIHRIIIDNSAVAIIVSFIFYSVNINRSCHFVIIVFIPDSIIVIVSNIMAFIGTLWNMYNKYKEFILLVIQDKLEGHLNEIIPLFGSDPTICKSVELNKQDVICLFNVHPSIRVSFDTTCVTFKLIISHQRLLH